MVWMYLIVQAVGLGVIAWCFKAEDKDAYAATCGVGGLLSLFLVLVVAPLPLKLLTGFLMVRFRSKINLVFSGGQEALLSCFKRILQGRIKLDSTDLGSILRLMPEPLTRFLTHHVVGRRQVRQTVKVQSPINNTIDIEAVEVAHWF